jgi:hypothetical protein
MASTGNAANTSLWTGADVFYAPLGTTGPTDVTTEWTTGWLALGLLDGDDGIVEKRDATTAESYAWGGIMFRRTVSKQARSFTFTALEDNDNVWLLANPGSTTASVTGIRTRVSLVPVAGNKFALGLETRDGARIKRRILPTCEVDSIDDLTDSETDPTAYKFTIIVYPDADGTLYTTVETDPTFVAGE